jgi:HD-GYP domain-containing protein (c-di-GMP phosphodiesterase class II)
MTHDRVYGPRLTAHQAAEELKRCSGTQFDPNVIKAFLRVLSKLDLEEPARRGGIVAEHLTEETAEETETAAECESGYLVKE